MRGTQFRVRIDANEGTKGKHGIGLDLGQLALQQGNLALEGGNRLLQGRHLGLQGSDFLRSFSPLFLPVLPWVLGRQSNLPPLRAQDR